MRRSKSKTASASSHSSDMNRQLNAISLEYSYEDLRIATDNFSGASKVGQGAYGNVFKGVLRDGNEVAIKYLHASSQTAGFEEEVKVLSKFRHQNLVILMGFSQRDHQRLLVYELLHGGDVGSRLQKGPLLSWKHRINIALDAACGLSHLHNQTPKVYHRDIKSANILLDRNGTAKWGDFGLACLSAKLSHKVLQTAGTVGYADPRYISTSIVTESTEVYSYGWVLIELLTAKPPAVQHHDGSISYFYSKLKDSKTGAPSIRNLLCFVDVSAKFPVFVKNYIAFLALKCINSDENVRPNFRSIVLELRKFLADCEVADQPTNNNHNNNNNVLPVHQSSQMRNAIAQTSTTRHDFSKVNSHSKQLQNGAKSPRMNPLHNDSLAKAPVETPNETRPVFDAAPANSPAWPANQEKQFVRRATKQSTSIVPKHTSETVFVHHQLSLSDGIDVANNVVSPGVHELPKSVPHSSSPSALTKTPMGQNSSQSPLAETRWRSTKPAIRSSIKANQRQDPASLCMQDVPTKVAQLGEPRYVLTDTICSTMQVQDRFSEPQRPRIGLDGVATASCGHQMPQIAFHQSCEEGYDPGPSVQLLQEKQNRASSLQKKCLEQQLTATSLDYSATKLGHNLLVSGCKEGRNEGEEPKMTQRQPTLSRGLENQQAEFRAANKAATNKHSAFPESNCSNESTEVPLAEAQFTEKTNSRWQPFRALLAKGRVPPNMPDIAGCNLLNHPEIRDENNVCTYEDAHLPAISTKSPTIAALVDRLQEAHLSKVVTFSDNRGLAVRLTQGETFKALDKPKFMNSEDEGGRSGTLFPAESKKSEVSNLNKRAASSPNSFKSKQSYDTYEPRDVTSEGRKMYTVANRDKQGRTVLVDPVKVQEIQSTKQVGVPSYDGSKLGVSSFGKTTASRTYSDSGRLSLVAKGSESLEGQSSGGLSQSSIKKRETHATVPSQTVYRCGVRSQIAEKTQEPHFNSVVTGIKQSLYHMSESDSTASRCSRVSSRNVESDQSIATPVFGIDGEVVEYRTESVLDSLDAVEVFSTFIENRTPSKHCVAEKRPQGATKAACRHNDSEENEGEAGKEVPRSGLAKFHKASRGCNLSSVHHNNGAKRHVSSDFKGTKESKKDCVIKRNKLPAHLCSSARNFQSSRETQYHELPKQGAASLRTLTETSPRTLPLQRRRNVSQQSPDIKKRKGKATLSNVQTLWIDSKDPIPSNASNQRAGGLIGRDRLQSHFSYSVRNPESGHRYLEVSKLDARSPGTMKETSPSFLQSQRRHHVFRRHSHIENDKGKSTVSNVQTLWNDSKDAVPNNTVTQHHERATSRRERDFNAVPNNVTSTSKREHFRSVVSRSTSKVPKFPDKQYSIPRLNSIRTKICESSRRCSRADDLQSYRSKSRDGCSQLKTTPRASDPAFRVGAGFGVADGFQSCITTGRQSVLEGVQESFSQSDSESDDNTDIQTSFSDSSSQESVAHENCSRETQLSEKQVVAKRRQSSEVQEKSSYFNYKNAKEDTSPSYRFHPMHLPPISNPLMGTTDALLPISTVTAKMREGKFDGTSRSRHSISNVLRSNVFPAIAFTDSCKISMYGSCSTQSGSSYVTGTSSWSSFSGPTASETITSPTIGCAMMSDAVLHPSETALPSFSLHRGTPTSQPIG